MSLDLTGARERIVGAELRAAELVERSIAAARSPACEFAFLSVDVDGARAAARAADDKVAHGDDPGPLAGLAISVKDLFDVAGEVTSAGSTLLAENAPATQDAPAVARLRTAGAALIGRTNMSEFAFSGVGINPHFGTAANPATRALDAVPRIPGGSTSGGAVSVAAGAAWAALGSDTGGSLRIPAALQGLVGFKPTARTVPTQGAVPLSTTLDSVGAITLSARDAALVHGLLAGAPVEIARRPLSQRRFAVAATLMQDALEPQVARAFDRALSALSAAGARVEPIALAELGELAAINASGGFSPAESWLWHRERMAADEARYDPRVARRIRRGEAIDAGMLAALRGERARWAAAVEAALRGFDAVLSPTVPIVAPLLAPLVADDDAFFATNALLLRNPSAVNFLDGCAISLPCHGPSELPAGLMIWHGALHDATVLSAALDVEAALTRSMSRPR